MMTLAIVVTYNRLTLLKQCLSCLAAQTTSCDILVIDNASNDGTQEYLKTQTDKGFHYICLPKNTGGAGGFNSGLRWGTEHGYDRLWVMDDDTLPRKDCLQKLLEADEQLHGHYGFLASTARWTDGNLCKMNILHPIKHFSCKHEAEPGLDRIEQATFVSCLFPRETVKKYGLPIKEFFIWGDDMEYTRRIAVRGREPCYWVHNSVVTHAMSNNNGSAIATDEPSRLDRYHYAYRNENYMYRREGLPGCLHYSVRCVVHILRVLIHAKNLKCKRMGIIMSEFMMGLRFNPQVEFVEIQCFRNSS